MEICEKEFCTGCLACVNICPVAAVSTIADSEGFLRPKIDSSRCIHCQKCMHTCPVNQPPIPSKEEKEVFACWHKQKRIRKRSTSGGAFSALAESVLDLGGVVYGAGFDSNNTVIHKQIVKKRALKELRGSKYVQSHIGLTFQTVKEQLVAGIPVLFSGTPCQIAGLYAYLGKKYDGQLWTVDLVCHGTPSPKVFKDYLHHLESKHNSKARRILFRDKTPGWFVFGMRIVFSNGRIYKKDTYKDPFIRGFLRELYLRPSCHCCPYSCTDRVADITLADFWGYRETCPQDRDDDKGISMVILNSDNAKKLFSSAKKKLVVWERTLQEAVHGNQALRECFPASKLRSEFWEDYDRINFPQIVDKYLYEEATPIGVQNRMAQINMISRANRKDFILHLPQIIMRNLLGNSRYESLKRAFKKGR